MLLTQLHTIHARHLAALRRSAHTITFYAHAVNQLTQYMTLRGETPDADNVTRATILGYQEWLREERKLKPGGEHAALRGLRATFRWALEEELITRDPTVRMRMPSLPHEQPPAIQPGEVELCLRQAKKSRHPLRDTAILYVLYDTGLRRGELISLRLEDVDLLSGAITVRAANAKTNRTRRVPLGIKSSRAINQYERRERHPAVPHIQELFLTHAGTPMTKDALNFILQSTGERAGLPRSHTAPHAWRRGFAVGLLRNGADLFALQTILGHTTLDMTRKYVRYLPDDIQRIHLRASPADRL
ncbi:tyrosine-type recombinase/integrase [Deinococcus arenicola]|uniref:Tyrosine-type recombinase/integrase n=1 Tax=Deinococcus arenicola TaxID=2994950 RepID=A0ABU4DUN1_9DEIO|nr:tyrosine-type recombinase/integrase [Deinococcus sp. ZS9-10]MDV6376149.1 tyrosine-type recombinase/integrase [Deinococcus sp. ZS9-10]